MSSDFRGKFSRSRRPKQKQVERFLIVSEGTETEPNYFRGFNLYVRPDIKVVGTGANTVAVVTQAIAERQKYHKNPEHRYDQVWCLFDKDDFSDQRFREALRLAKEHDIHVAYSIESFELWFLLHFSLIHTEIGREAYLRKLSAHFKQLGYGAYRKNDKAIYDKLRPYQSQALRNAASLSQGYLNETDILRHDPETTVNQLVEALNQQGKDRFDA
ncbi:RloB family protein [Lacticaseibacillus paracasei]|uniref:RloB family protein n=1 Tax=Lacticaseibacillus paracasei TaxID=1597 RepID=UPI0037DFC6EB